MAYLGTPPQSGFITTAKQRVTSSTNNYVDLDHAISSIADVIVFVNFVKQDTTNLTLTTSTRITLGGTLVSSDIVEIHYLGKAVNTQTPATGTVTNDMLAGSIANSKLANSSITLNGSAVSLGGSATVGGDNTPAFHVHKTSGQTIANATATLMTFEAEDFDTDNAFDLSTERFTPQVAGKYFLYASVRWDTADDFDISYLTIRKNGSAVFTGSHGNKFYDFTKTSGIVEANGSSDYFDVTVQHSRGSNLSTQGGDYGNYFGGFKIIT
jgi:hypothetical protein